MVCTGTRTKAEVYQAVDEVLEILRKHDIDVPDEAEIKIENMVASADLHSDIDVETLFDVSDNAMYEPEQLLHA